MGIYLGLRVLPDAIGAVEWERFYDAAKQVIQAFEPQPVRLTEEEKFGFTRLVLTRSPEGQDHKGRFLAVVGDAQTWECAEQFHIYRGFTTWINGIRQVVNYTLSLLSKQVKSSHGGIQAVSGPAA
ncbi:MAG: hypothetical protein PWR22_2274 [Moorella sp. (in: firmicutes)]|nr:hypothetical protein [Moorella sp. (in: firmicutes)]